MIFSQIHHKPTHYIVTFYKIRHGLKTNHHGPTYCILLVWHEYIMLVSHVRFALKKTFFTTEI
jgi:hypothetical protein